MRSLPKRRRLILPGFLAMALGGCVQVWVPDPLAPSGYAGTAYGPGAASAAEAGALIGAAMGAALAASAPPGPPAAIERPGPTGPSKGPSPGW